MNFFSNSKPKKMTREKYQRQLLKRRRKTKLKPWVVLILILFFSSILIYNLIVLIRWKLENKAIKKIEKDLEESVLINEVYDANNDNSELIKSDDYFDYINLPFYDVDFNELINKNNDTIGFISVNGTKINYPIVQTSDNDFYLDHAFDKSKNNAGWVFLDYRNDSSFSDFNSIIYGHGRLNGTVFGSLKELLSDNWQGVDDNYFINVSTPTINFVYHIFSIYTIDSETYYIKTNFSGYKERLEWINNMKERNTSEVDVDVTSTDKVITLSTCLNNYGGRVVVHAKMIKQQKKSS